MLKPKNIPVLSGETATRFHVMLNDGSFRDDTDWKKVARDLNTIMSRS